MKMSDEKKKAKQHMVRQKISKSCMYDRLPGKLLDIFLRMAMETFIWVDRQYCTYEELCFILQVDNVIACVHALLCFIHKLPCYAISKYKLLV